VAESVIFFILIARSKLRNLDRIDMIYKIQND
jgi:hypothetical protein